MAVLRELHADVIALQEADRRIGARPSVLPRALLDDSPWRVADVAKRPQSIGWHGNALLVRRDLVIGECHAIDLPTLEPRGAACAVIGEGRDRFRVVGTHLDLSGIRRRDQVRSIVRFMSTHGDMRTVVLGDFNQWGQGKRVLGEFPVGWREIAPGPTYPARRPVSRLDRAVHSEGWHLHAAAVHHSALASFASDHLPLHLDLSPA